MAEPLFFYCSSASIDPVVKHEIGKYPHSDFHVTIPAGVIDAIPVLYNFPTHNHYQYFDIYIIIYRISDINDNFMVGVPIITSRTIKPSDSFRIETVEL